MIYIFLIDGTGTCDRIKEDKFVSAENLQGVYDAVVRNIDFFLLQTTLAVRIRDPGIILFDRCRGYL